MTEVIKRAVAHAGYIVDDAVIGKLVARGWHLAHNLPGVIEWRKQDEHGRWTLAQNSVQWIQDFLDCEKETIEERSTPHV